MIETIGAPAMLEQLAEESAELAHAALKTARILRNENPTPINYKDAVDHLAEEFTDVFQCAQELNLQIDSKQMHDKNKRFLKRVEEMGQYQAVTMPENRELCEAVHEMTKACLLTRVEWQNIIAIINRAAGRIENENKNVD